MVPVGVPHHSQKFCEHLQRLSLKKKHEELIQLSESLVEGPVHFSFGRKYIVRTTMMKVDLKINP